MNLAQFKSTLTQSAPPAPLPAPLAALWWDAKGDWTRPTPWSTNSNSQDGMAVHAYLHRKGPARQRRLLVRPRRPPPITAKS